MKTAKEILDETSVELYNSEFDEVVKAMEEYAEQQSDYVQQLFTRPQEAFKPLQDLYRKENPHPEGKFYLPDSTQFYKWIADKIQKKEDYNEYICKRISDYLMINTSLKVESVCDVTDLLRKLLVNKI